jgi:hypothetical protein
MMSLGTQKAQDVECFIMISRFADNPAAKRDQGVGGKNNGVRLCSGHGETFTERIPTRRFA